MIAPSSPKTADGPLVTVWNGLYEHAYRGCRGLATICLRPLFLTRLVGPLPPLPPGPVIVCANHASYLDPVFVQTVVPRRIVFVMTNDFYRHAAGKWFFKLVGAIPVGTGRLARDGLERAIGLLRQGQSVGIFPEGRLSTDGTLSPPQRGVAILSRMGRAPVLPLGIDGNLRAWPKGRTWMRRADVRVCAGPLIAPPKGQTRDAERAFAREVMDAVGAARERARAEGRKTGTPRA